jgi:UrcA family protein
MYTKTRMLVLSLLAAVGVSSVALADTAVNVKSETVRYDDLRLISPVGASVLYARLRSAAERVCGGPALPGQIAEQHRYRACVDEALAKAVTDVNHPVLNQYAALRRSTPAAAPTNVAESASTASVSIVAKAK